MYLGLGNPNLPRYVSRRPLLRERVAIATYSPSNIDQPANSRIIDCQFTAMDHIQSVVRPN